MISVEPIFWLSILLLLHPEGSHGYAKKDYFSSISGLEELLSTETFLLSHLQSYVKSMSSHLEQLKNEIDEIENEHKAAANDLEGYLTSPVNAFLLIKRLDKDWKTLQGVVENDVARQSLIETLNFSRENLSYPTEEDTAGSAIALARLQDTYQLDVSQVAAGILNGVKYGSSMSWRDCFQLGKQLYELKYYNHTIPWLKESIEKLQTKEYYNSPETIAFMEMVVYYHGEMGNFRTALELNSKVLELEPERIYSLNYKKYLENMIELGHGLIQPPVFNEYWQTNDFVAYEKVCRGEIKPSPSEEKLLRCRNYHRDVPYRLLMPFKMEELNLSPYVVYFHGVIDDDEIQSIKELSKSKMVRSGINAPSGKAKVPYRTSKSAFLKYNVLPATKKLKRRLTDITGLNTAAYEQLHVANYGIGGHYEPHLDSLGRDPIVGDRIATAIFYLSDVEQGGATCFPKLKRAVQPRKGNLMFWFNLHKDGERDLRTLHGACPVLKGSKWIATVWIRERKQMFSRPCGLQPDHTIAIPNLIGQ